MSQIQLNQMADIFLPVAAQVAMPWWLQLLITALVFILLTISLVLWRYFSHPLKHLERQIINKKLSSRAGAHQLASLLEANTSIASELLQQIDQLRFQRQNPPMADLLALIKQARHEW